MILSWYLRYFHRTYPHRPFNSSPTILYSRHVHVITVWSVVTPTNHISQLHSPTCSKSGYITSIQSGKADLLSNRFPRESRHPISSPSQFQHHKSVSQLPSRTLASMLVVITQDKVLYLARSYQSQRNDIHVPLLGNRLPRHAKDVRNDLILGGADGARKGMSEELITTARLEARRHLHPAGQSLWPPVGGRRHSRRRRRGR